MTMMTMIVIIIIITVVTTVSDPLYGLCAKIPRASITRPVFETFYQHFDMKSIYKRDFIQILNLNENKLSSTKWFKSKIENIIK